ncbi:hypothetical protein D3C86_1343390 [compost metagenome]
MRPLLRVIPANHPWQQRFVHDFTQTAGAQTRRHHRLFLPLQRGHRLGTKPLRSRQGLSGGAELRTQGGQPDRGAGSLALRLHRGAGRRAQCPHPGSRGARNHVGDWRQQLKLPVALCGLRGAERGSQDHRRLFGRDGPAARHPRPDRFGYLLWPGTGGLLWRAPAAGGRDPGGFSPDLSGEGGQRTSYPADPNPLDRRAAGLGKPEPGQVVPA